jgi:hypothetical protein
MMDFDQTKRHQVQIKSRKKRDRLKIQFYELINHALEEIQATQGDLELPKGDQQELIDDVTSIARYIYVRLTGKEVMHDLSVERMEAVLTSKDEDED